MRNLFIVPLLFVLGCGSGMSADSGPEVGSVFHPETDLTTVPDADLLHGYEVALMAVDNCEADLWEMEAGTVPLHARTTMLLLGKDKTTLETRLKEYTQVKERLYKEIQRRGLIPWEHKRIDYEFGDSHLMLWHTYRLHKHLWGPVKRR